MNDEDTIKALREQVARLTHANEILIAQRDELRRIFERPVGGIPHVMAQAAVRDLIRDTPATTTGNAIDDGPGF